jgi:hypothetical protein
MDGNMRAEVVKAVFDYIGGTKKVLLSPSMSGWGPAPAAAQAACCWRFHCCR